MKQQHRSQRRDYKSLQSKEVCSNFTGDFIAKMQHCPYEENINMLMMRMNDAIHFAKQKNIPAIEVMPKKPWISMTTLRLIEERIYYRSENDAIMEKALSHRIKKQAKLDREEWLNTMLAEGNWSALKKYQRQRKKNMKSI